MKTKYLIGLSALSLILSLTACNNHPSSNNSQASQATRQTTSVDKIDASLLNKEETAYNEYLTAATRIDDSTVTGGRLSQQLADYKLQDLANTPHAELSGKFKLAALNHALTHLKNASGTRLGAPYADLDRTGQALTQKTEAFTRTLAKMEALMADKGAESKGEVEKLDSAFVTQADAFISAYKDFSDALTAANIYRTKQTAKDAKAAGNIRRALAYDSYAAAQTFRSLLESSNPGDAQTAGELEKQVADMKNYLDDFSSKNKEIEDIKSPKYASAQDQLKGLLSIMREAGNNKYDQWFVGEFNREYNRFVRDVVDAGVLD